MEKPSLTEPGVKFFMSKVLKHCSQQKYMFSNLVFNVVLFLVFVLIIGVFCITSIGENLHLKKKKENLEKKNKMF